MTTKEHSDTDSTHTVVNGTDLYDIDDEDFITDGLSEGEDTVITVEEDTLHLTDEEDDTEYEDLFAEILDRLADLEEASIQSNTEGQGTVSQTELAKEAITSGSLISTPIHLEDVLEATPILLRLKHQQ